MRAKVRFLRAAQLDLESSALSYEAQSAGLGEAFLLEVEKCSNLMRDHPELYQEVDSGVRRALTNRFPYAIYYQLREDRILVIGIVHTSRDPKVWKRRVRNKR